MTRLGPIKPQGIASLGTSRSCARPTRQGALSSRVVDPLASASTRKPTDLPIGASVLVRWWPVDRPVDDGWRIAVQRPVHHHRWSILVEKI